MADFFDTWKSGCIPPPLEYYQFKASYHEAGHAVIAYLHGACIDSLEISKSDASGCIRAHFLLSKAFRKNLAWGIRQKSLIKESREEMINKILKARLDIHLAGLVAEELIFGIANFETGRSDLRNFHIDVGKLLKKTATGSEVLAMRKHHWQACEKELAENWEWVERIAAELFDRKFLLHQDVQRLRQEKLYSSEVDLFGEVIYVDFANKNRICDDDVIS